MSTLFLTLGLATLIGLLLGALGGGGSILTVPMLVYLLHVEPKTAIVTSFVVVGLSSLLALIPHARRGSVCWKSGWFFGLAGMFGAFVGGRLAGHFSGDMLMALFGLVSLATGLLMLRGQRVTRDLPVAGQVRVCPLRVPFMRVLFDGFFVGSITGMVGVGGGFLIVPALTLLVGLPMQGAVGTSLLIIVMNALAGLAGFSQHISFDAELTLLVAAGALVGSALGAWLSAFIKPAALRGLFGVMVIIVAGYVLSQALSQQLITAVEAWPLDDLTLCYAVLGMLAIFAVLWVGHTIHKTDVRMDRVKQTHV